MTSPSPESQVSGGGCVAESEEITPAIKEEPEGNFRDTAEGHEVSSLSSTGPDAREPHENRALVVFRNVVDSIYDQLALGDITLLSATQASMKLDAKSYVRRRLSSALKVWFKDPHEFRRIMRSSQAIISGSFALAFILGESWNPSDLDVYVSQKQDQNQLRTFLKKEGYIKIKGHKLPLYSAVFGPWADVTKYCHATCQSTIDVIEVYKGSPVSPILNFHSTIVMNWITADAVYMAYPALTHRRIGVVHPELGFHDPDAFAKYRQRGFVLVSSMEKLRSGCGAACPSKTRSTADASCLHFWFSDSPPSSTVAPRMWSCGHGLHYWALNSAGWMPVPCTNTYCARATAQLRASRRALHNRE